MVTTSARMVLAQARALLHLCPIPSNEVFTDPNLDRTYKDLVDDLVRTHQALRQACRDLEAVEDTVAPLRTDLCEALELVTDLAQHIMVKGEEEQVGSPAANSALLPTQSYCQLSATANSALLPTESYCQLNPTANSILLPTQSYCQLNPTAN